MAKLVSSRREAALRNDIAEPMTNATQRTALSMALGVFLIIALIVGSIALVFSAMHL